MMIPKELVKRIGELLQEGQVIELELKPDGHLNIFPRPVAKYDIDIPASLLANDCSIRVRLTAQRLGDEPVMLLDQNLPAGTWILGLKCAQGESIEDQEETE